MDGLHISELSLQIDGQTILDSVSLDIAKGQMCYLIGPAGAGKTALLRTLAGHTQPSHGEYLLDGRALSGKNNPAAILFQQGAFWSHLTVGQNIALALNPLGLSADQTQARVLFGLAQALLPAEVATRMPASLSGGMQQQVSLGRAFAAHSNFLLLDEPFAHLDTATRQAMSDQIRQYCREYDAIALCATQAIDFVFAQTDDVILMRNGTIAQQGSPQNIYRTPASVFAAEFSGEVGLYKGTLNASGAGEGLVACALGEFRAALGASAETMDLGKAVLAIRPEAWHLDTMPAEENCLEGVVDTHRFGRGLSHCRFVPTGGIAPFTIALQYPQNAFSTDELYAWVAPEDALILPDC